MALPTLDKTWQFNVNQKFLPSPTTTIDDLNRSILKAVVDSIIGFATNPWTVTGSSNGTSFGMDGVNRWGTVSGINTNAWIVLRQTEIHSDLYMTIHNQTGGARVSLQNGLPTGGTATTPPTHPTTWNTHISSLSTFSIAGTSPIPHYLHVMQSTDGQCTRIILVDPTSTAARIRWAIFVEKPKNPRPYWTTPVWGVSDFTLGLTSAITSGASSTSGFTGYRTSRFAMGMCGYSKPGSSSGGVANDAASGSLGPYTNRYNNQALIQPVGLGTSYSGERGRHGDIFDLWIAPSFMRTGTTFPAGSGRQFVVFGNFVFPWNGSVPTV